MDDCRLPKRLFYGELSTGKRTTGRPKKRYKDTLKDALKLCTIPQATRHEIAVDRAAWRSRVRSGVDDFEEGRIKQKEERRQKRKECQNPAPQPDPAHSFPCPRCNRLFCARIGLISHLCTTPHTSEVMVISEDGGRTSCPVDMNRNAIRFRKSLNNNGQSMFL